MLKLTDLVIKYFRTKRNSQKQGNAKILLFTVTGRRIYVGFEVVLFLHHRSDGAATCENNVICI